MTPRVRVASRRPREVNPRRLAAYLLSAYEDFPTALGEGERALVLELKIERDSREDSEKGARNHAQAAWKWRERYMAVRAALVQAEAEVAMYRQLLAGYQQAEAVPAPERPAITARHD